MTPQLRKASGLVQWLALAPIGWAACGLGHAMIALGVFLAGSGCLLMETGDRLRRMAG